ncbi:MAG: U32 family peptidase [Alphaproteobacteria bacterium]|nr:U32 family peptidase [Alphaproteobacteria bacterium]
MDAQLTLGPVLFNWDPEKWRDFYFRIADEAPIDTVYVGEVVCSKRAPLFEPFIAETIERLAKGGKKVVFSTLAEVMLPRERKMTEDLCAADEYMVEANDASALYRLRGKPHCVGPFVNAYNEETLAVLAELGAKHFTLPPELPGEAIPAMAVAAKRNKVSLEVQVYGRLPLAISARCYHARAHGKMKDNCQYVCGEDADGMPLKTIDGQDFLVVNGVQTLSHLCLCLMGELGVMRKAGITAFRLSPHSHDMVGVAHLFRDVLDGKAEAAQATRKLEKMRPDMPLANGFFYRKPGHMWITGDTAQAA